MPIKTLSDVVAVRILPYGSKLTDFGKDRINFRQIDIVVPESERSDGGHYIIQNNTYLITMPPLYPLLKRKTIVSQYLLRH